MTLVDQSLVPLTLYVGRLSARGLDLTALLRRICTALPHATGAAGAVTLVGDPSDREPTLVASDPVAGRIGEVQRRSGAGPLPAVARSGRPLHTPDLTRVGPPALAAAAAETGLTSSLVVPLVAGDERFGGLQLLSGTRRPVDPAQVEVLAPLLATLVARLVDLRALRQAGERPVPQPAPAAPPPPDTQVDPSDVATTPLPAMVGTEKTTQVVAVPAQRRSAGARHRRADGSGGEPRQPRAAVSAGPAGRHAASPAARRA